MKTETQNLFRVAIVGALPSKQGTQGRTGRAQLPSRKSSCLMTMSHWVNWSASRTSGAGAAVGRDDWADGLYVFASEEEFTRRKWKLSA